MTWLRKASRRSCLVPLSSSPPQFGSASGSVLRRSRLAHSEFETPFLYELKFFKEDLGERGGVVSPGDPALGLRRVGVGVGIRRTGLFAFHSVGFMPLIGEPFVHEPADFVDLAHGSMSRQGVPGGHRKVFTEGVSLLGLELLGRNPDAGDRMKLGVTVQPFDPRIIDGCPGGIVAALNLEEETRPPCPRLV